MTYRDAKRLHNEDEVTLKNTGEVMKVVETTITEKMVYVMLEDGNEYSHKEIK